MRGPVRPQQEVEYCRNELTESDNRKLRKLPGISWPGRKAVGGSKIVSQMEKLRLREVSGSPYSELTGWQAPHTAESCHGALVTQCSQGCSPREHVHAQLCGCFEESMEPWTQMPLLFCSHPLLCDHELSSTLPLNKALEASSTFKLLTSWNTCHLQDRMIPKAHRGGET